MPDANSLLLMVKVNTGKFYALVSETSRGTSVFHNAQLIPTTTRAERQLTQLYWNLELS